MKKNYLNHHVKSLLLLFLAFSISLISCEKDQWDTQYMRTGAILKVSSHGKRIKNYEARFYLGKVKINSDIALGIKQVSNELIRTQRGDDGKPENLWLPEGTITVVIVSEEHKAFAFTTFDTSLDKYAVIQKNFTNTTNWGCGKLYMENWEEPVTFL